MINMYDMNKSLYTVIQTLFQLINSVGNTARSG